MQTTKKALRAKEVSEIMGIGLSTVWSYAKQGILTPRKISTKVTLFNYDEVMELIGGAK